MLYTVNLDELNYILSVSHSDKDSIDLDLDSMDLQHLNAYRIDEGIAILDQVKLAELIAQEERQQKDDQITELIRQLEATNDDMLDFVERLCGLNNPLTFISDLIALMKNYSALVLARQNIRQQIKELKK